MREELGLQRRSLQWLDAWRVPLPRAATATPAAPALPQLRRPQVAALLALSLVMATDLYLWEILLRWAGDHFPAALLL
jgi:hypothetical protein